MQSSDRNPAPTDRSAPRPLPRRPVPALDLEPVDGKPWKLSQRRPGQFVLIAFYRGLHCPICKGWLGELDKGPGKTSAGVEEPPLFAEPSVFLVRPDGTLYASAVSTMPFARPHFREVMQAIDFVVSKDYPARGEA